MLTRRLIPLAAILLLTSYSADSPAPLARDREADAMQQHGERLLDAQRVGESRVLLSDALRRHMAAGDHVAASTDAVLLSRIHQQASQRRDALRLAELAFAEAALSGDDETIARALIARGDTHVRAGDTLLALGDFGEATRHVAESDKKRRAWLGINVSWALLELGRRREARSKLEEGLDLARDIGEHRWTVGVTTNLAHIALLEGRLDDAERHLRDAHAAQRLRNPARVSPGAMLNEAILARRRGNLSAATVALDRIRGPFSEETRWVIAHERGMIAEAAGQLDIAERRFGDAVHIVERLRADLKPEESNAAFIDEFRQPYESLFELHLRRDDTRGAFATLAQAQGRVFLDARMMTMADTATAQQAPISDRFRIPGFDQLMASPPRSNIEDPRSPEAMLAAVRGKHVLSYFLAGERLRLMTAVDGEPRATTVDVDLDQLEWLIDDFRIRSDDPRAADALGSVLLPPESLPSPPARIHIVPMGPLLRVPFTALRVAGARLLDRYEVVYAPSVTGLAAMSAERKPTVGPGLIVADTRSDLEHAGIESRFVVESTGATPRLGAERHGLGPASGGRPTAASRHRAFRPRLAWQLPGPG